MSEKPTVKSKSMRFGARRRARRRLPVSEPPEQEWRVHQHGGITHQHFVRIDQPEHDHR